MAKINEATSTDLPVIKRLADDFGWKNGDTLLYQQTCDIPENLKQDYSSLKNIRPDIILHAGGFHPTVGKERYYQLQYLAMMHFCEILNDTTA